VEPTELAQRCAPIVLLLSDVDGVLTGGGVLLDSRGGEIKQFHIRDGQGVRLWHEAGLRFGLVTSRNSPIVAARAAELGIDLVYQGVAKKLAVLTEIRDQLGLQLSQIAYVGDDLLDLAAIRAAGLGIAVADAAAEVRENADYVTRLRGGEGAIREVVEMLLKQTSRWQDALKPYIQ
jgi:YrbI family 3-deoxy-D-manno-octulosonate 8-phosphate phosphatase